MPKNKTRGRGGFRGANPDQARGRGRGGFRGRGRGRGRGGPVFIDEFDLPIQQWPSNEPPSDGNPRGVGIQRARGRGRGAYSPYGSGANTPRRGFPSPFGRGRGRGIGSTPDEPQNTQGRARGLESKLKGGVPLSQVLYEDRPLLKPVVFVRSVHTAILFEKEEDIFQPVVEGAAEDEQSHIPTADTVSRVFHLRTQDGGENGAEDEELEEIDFGDIGRIQAEVDAAAAQATVTETTSTSAKESVSFFVDTTPGPVHHVPQNQEIHVNKLQGALGRAEEDDEVIVYVAPYPTHTTPSHRKTTPPSIDPTLTTSILTGLSVDPSASTASPPSIGPTTTSVGQPGGDGSLPPAEATIQLGTLYPEEPTAPAEPQVQPATAPFQMSPNAAELPPPPSFEDISFSFDTRTVKKQTRRLHPVGTPRSLLGRSRKPRRKPLRGFGAYGAMHEEALLHDVDPRRDEQRRGDSDVNWGDSSEEEGVEELSAGIADMEIDEGISMAAMKSFVHSMSAEGSQHVTMDDVADIERMRKEDEGEEPVRGAESAKDSEDEEAGDVQAASSRGGPSESDDDEEDDEAEAVLHAAEAELIGESDGDGEDAQGNRVETQRAAHQKGIGSSPGNVEDAEEDEEDDEDEDGDEDEDESDDEEETPQRGFQARLERLGASTGKGKGKGKVRATSSDDSSDEAMSVQMSWAEEDEEYFDSIEAILEANQHILLSRDRKAKKELFTSIRDGTFEQDTFADMMTPAKRGKDKDIPPELRGQWEKDREKKAENKRKRALERQQLAADPLAMHKSGKKGRKAMLAAARAADDADLPNRITDLVSLEQQIRRFLADIGGSNTLALPPADKETRKRVHELALAFNVKSQSKGKGAARYTTLIKTSRSGVGIDERKIRRILKQATNGAWVGPDGGRGKGWSKAMSLAKHREGEVVGKEAPKIGETNIGFKMLAAMGWADGERIGQSGGLEVPLTAIMKKTKLGLGATM
ncbi:hypothetical protein BD413DRAFT_558254 [Trametes elegans]|nr:hypothetical protein BD413DRAFT_558254 [Trametes elegans]